MTAARHAQYTRDEYINFERGANVKHEFFQGSIYAMAGGTPEHAAIAGNVTAFLSLRLRDRPCRVYTSDLRIRVGGVDLDTYPDASVICGRPKLDPADKHAATNPLLVVEVTSPGSETYDRGDKLEHYKRLPSLREVVIVSHRERLVEVFRREDDGRWSRHEARAGGAAKLSSIDCELPVDEVYRDPLAQA